jgi:hypothetical protein
MCSLSLKRVLIICRMVSFREETLHNKLANLMLVLSFLSIGFGCLRLPEEVLSGAHFSNRTRKPLVLKRS